MSILRIVMMMMRRTRQDHVLDGIVEAEREIREQVGTPPGRPTAAGDEMVHMDPPQGGHGTSLAEALAEMDRRHNDAVRRLVLALLALAFLTIGSIALTIYALTRPAQTTEQVERP